MCSRLPNCRHFNDQQSHSMLPPISFSQCFIFSGWGRGDWGAGGRGGGTVFIHVSSDRRSSFWSVRHAKIPSTPISRHKLHTYRHHAASSTHTGITPQAPSIPASRHKLHTYWHHATNSLPIPASCYKLHRCRYYATSSNHTGIIRQAPPIPATCH